MSAPQRGEPKGGLQEAVDVFEKVVGITPDFPLASEHLLKVRRGTASAGICHLPEYVIYCTPSTRATPYYPRRTLPGLCMGAGLA